MVFRVKGRTPTKKEKEHLTKTAELGCIASIQSGLIHPFTECPSLQIHHPFGKTKAATHFLVLPLIKENHNYMYIGSIHYNQPAFEKKYGTERELWHRAQALIYPSGFPSDILELLESERYCSDFFNQELYEGFLV